MSTPAGTQNAASLVLLSIAVTNLTELYWLLRWPPTSATFASLSLLSSSSSFYWALVDNALNVLQPHWLTVLPLDIPDLTASLLL